MSHIFSCSCEYSSGKSVKWNGTWMEVMPGEGLCELLISGRGSLYSVLVGRYTSGYFLCIPEIGIGCPLSRLSDVFWNFERLSGLICRTDAATIAYALEDYDKQRTAHV